MKLVVPAAVRIGSLAVGRLVESFKFVPSLVRCCSSSLSIRLITVRIISGKSSAIFHINRVHCLNI